MKKTLNYKIIALYTLIICMAQTSMIICPPPANKTATKKTTQPTPTSKSSLFTPTMTTTSINEKAIDSIYGKTGLNLAPTDITQIKQTYGYLEMIVKSHKIATDPTLKNIQNSLIKMASSKKIAMKHHKK